jgi:hypothetical protein
MSSEGPQPGVGVSATGDRLPKDSRKRSRYLGVEVIGAMPPPGGLRRILLSMLEKGGDFQPGNRVDLRVVKARGRYALVEIPHTLLPRARVSWNSEEIRTHRTWGTLKRGKLWLTIQESGRHDRFH